MDIEVVMMQSFVDGDSGGNPAGVVFPADGLTKEQKQDIAARVGVSETAYISKSETAAFKLEFFTPRLQLPHCGHATVASFCYLAANHKVGEGWTSKETIEGNRKIFISDGKAFMQQMKPVYTSPQSRGVAVDAILRALGLNENDLLPGCEPTVASTGNTFLMVPLKDIATLRRIQSNDPAIYTLSEKLDVHGFYSFCLETMQPGRDAAARMFAPFVGIHEESATGTAAGPLAGYLFDYVDIKKKTIWIEQGKLMSPPSPSLLQIDLDLEDGVIKGMMVGGRALPSGEKTIQI